MTTFNDREKAFEKKFEHDQDLQFKVNARKNKLLGLWAAGLMGKSGADAEAYAKEVVVADFEKPGDSDVIEKLVKDLAAAGKPMEDHTIRKQAERLRGSGQGADHEGDALGVFCGRKVPRCARMIRVRVADVSCHRRRVGEEPVLSLPGALRSSSS